MCGIPLYLHYGKKFSGSSLGLFTCCEEKCSQFQVDASHLFQSYMTALCHTRIVLDSSYNWKAIKLKSKLGHITLLVYTYQRQNIMLSGSIEE